MAAAKITSSPVGEDSQKSPKVANAAQADDDGDGTGDDCELRLKEDEGCACNQRGAPADMILACLGWGLFLLRRRRSSGLGTAA